MVNGEKIGSCNLTLTFIRQCPRHTYTHTYTRACVHAHAHVHTHTHTHTCACTHVHTHTHTHTHIHTHACMHACAHTHTHTYTHTRVHARTCTHTHTRYYFTQVPQKLLRELVFNLSCRQHADKCNKSANLQNKTLSRSENQKRQNCFLV